MKVLITGGAGFIGSHLVDKLIEQGNNIIVLDNLSSGRKENLKSHIYNPKFAFIKGDIRNEKNFQNLPRDIDVIYHLAALTNARESIVKPKLYFDVNVSGSFNVLEFCRMVDAKIVFVSSAAVYGNHKKPVKETDACKPLSPYGKYKLIVENLIKSYNDFYGIPFSIFRLFNVYGPRSTSGVINIIMSCIQNNRPFYLFGDGKQKRDFVFIEDVIRILIQEKKVENEVLNVGTGKATSILELLNIFRNIGKNLKVIKKEMEKGEIETSCADVTNLKKIFPLLEFKTIDEAIKSFKD